MSIHKYTYGWIDFVKFTFQVIHVTYFDNHLTEKTRQ